MDHARLQLAHAGQPAIGVCGLALKVGEHLGVGQDQEGFRLDRGKGHLGYLGGLEHLAGGPDHGIAQAGTLTVARARLARVRHARVEHWGVDPLGAETADVHPGVAVSDAQPFGEGHGSVLGDRVRSRTDLAQQPGSGGGAAEVALAARQPPRKEVLRRPAVGVNVDGEGQFPVGFLSLGTEADRDARVGPEQVDRAEGLLCSQNEVAVAVLGADIGDHGQRATNTQGLEVIGYRSHPFCVDVADHYPCTTGVELRGQGPTDATRGAGDHHILPARLHGLIVGADAAKDENASLAGTMPSGARPRDYGRYRVPPSEGAPDDRDQRRRHQRGAERDRQGACADDAPRTRLLR